MPDKHRRKTLQQPEKRRSKHIDVTRSPPTVFWMPEENAGYEAWAQATVKAMRESGDVLGNYRLHPEDETIRQAMEHASQFIDNAWQHAYPPGFWEGMEDLRTGKPSNLEAYIAFLEADSYFFRSSYVKADVIRYLKRYPLTSAQQRRLQYVILNVVRKGFRREFRSYCHLARYVQSEVWLREVEAQLASNDPNHVLRAQWILSACRRR